MTATGLNELEILDHDGSSKGLWLGSSETAANLVTADAAELNVLKGGIHGVTYTVGAEAGNSINVGIQLEDANGDPIEEIGVVYAYLSDDSGGDGIAATAPDGDVAVGTDGTILAEITADKIFLLQSEADGDIDLDIGESSAKSFYLCIIIPATGLLEIATITFT
jgi:hypothetical protein